ncbi:MAG TPA: hypothetical protein PKK26_12375 [Candidatus Wallbacteria bacterium]|nr:hypothetical protein [Candidatus Wallbacteria bacterium]
MTQSFFEILLMVPAAFCAGFVMFIGGVIQGVMDDEDEAMFKRILTGLHKNAMKSPYAIGISSITFVGMIPYFYKYGCSNRWFTAGLIFWVLTSCVSKATNLPIYGRVFAIESTDTARLGEERRKLHNANMLRAALSFISIAIMVVGFY